jgi:hypothetical protein
VVVVTAAELTALHGAVLHPWTADDVKPAAVLLAND